MHEKDKFYKKSDAPSGQPENDPSVPYEHMSKYNGKTARYAALESQGNVKFFGTGKIRVTESFIDIVGDSNRLTVPKSSVEPIAWHEETKSYTLGNVVELEIKSA